MSRSIMRRGLVLLSFSAVLVAVLMGTSVAAGSAKRVRASGDGTTSYGPLSPTFVGPTAAGCASGCSLLTGPFTTQSTASAPPTIPAAGPNAGSSGPHTMRAPTERATPRPSGRPRRQPR